MSEAAVKVAVHRLRRRFRDLLREEVLRTVDDPRNVDHELRYLFAAVGKSQKGPPV
jgi:RNA polymerase sigma-70 factor (ECF subfamily)